MVVARNSHRLPSKETGQGREPLMNLVNATRLLTEYTLATDRTGREWLVVVAKGTYGIPDDPDCFPALLDEQVPLAMTDVFTGEPGVSAPRYEIDFAPRKPRCDVLLNGSCYAPGGKPATVPVGMRVGTMVKSFNVVGNRVWRSNALHMSISSSEPFTVLPLCRTVTRSAAWTSRPRPPKRTSGIC